MKHLKMLGLAAVAAAALMSLAGGGSASAAVLCHEEKDPCGVRVAAGEEVKSQAVGGVALNSTVKSVNCKSSTLSGEEFKEGGKGEVPEVVVETLSFTECSCEVLVTKDGTYFVSHSVGTFSGMLFGTGQEIVTQCTTILGKLKCVYLTNNTNLGEFLGGNPAVIDVNATLPVVEAASHPACKEGNWIGQYEVTKPKPVYVASS